MINLDCYSNSEEFKNYCLKVKNAANALNHLENENPGPIVENFSYKDLYRWLIINDLNDELSQMTNGRLNSVVNSFKEKIIEKQDSNESFSFVLEKLEFIIMKNDWNVLRDDEIRRRNYPIPFGLNDDILVWEKV